MNKKKVLFISLVSLDVAITLFLSVISIIMLALVAIKKDVTAIQARTDFLGYLARTPGVFMGAFVVPLFLLLVANIIATVFYVNKKSKEQAKSVKQEDNKISYNDLTSEQKDQLLEELIAERQKEASKENKEDKQKE